MAKTQLSAALLREFAQLLRNEMDRFGQIKSSMDTQLLKGFLWEDPVAQHFKAKYEEELAPIEKKLIPAMDTYQQYLDEGAKRGEEYAEIESPSISAFKTSAAAFAGIGVAGAATIGIADSPSLSSFKTSAAAFAGTGDADPAATGIADSPSLSSFKTSAAAFAGTGDADPAAMGIADSPSLSASKQEMPKPDANNSPSIDAMKQEINKPNIGQNVAFNHDAAIETLQKQAKPREEQEGRCAEYVRKALEAGGLKMDETGHAYRYNELLPKKGFEKQDITFKLKEIKKGDTSRWTYKPNKEIKKGDIVVFDRIPGKKEYGHIQMYDGKNWISDFKQTYLHVWKDIDFSEVTYSVYRST